MRRLSKHSRGGRARPAMNVTPLVDVVLVLLIIFMVVLPNTEAGANIELPKLAHAEADPEEANPFVVVLAEEGGLSFGGEGLETKTVKGMEALRARLDEAHASQPERMLLLRADRRVEYGRMRELFGTAQDIGFPGIMLRVNGEPEGSGTVASTDDPEAAARGER